MIPSSILSHGDIAIKKKNHGKGGGCGYKSVTQR